MRPNKDRKRDVAERPESWLEWVWNDLDSNKEFLAEGVYSFAVSLLGMIESRDIPSPDMRLNGEGHYILDWKLGGDRLFLMITGPGKWRYMVRNRKVHHERLHRVARDHADTIRSVFGTMFLVNSVGLDVDICERDRDCEGI